MSDFHSLRCLLAVLLVVAVIHVQATHPKIILGETSDTIIDAIQEPTPPSFEEKVASIIEGLPYNVTTAFQDYLNLPEEVYGWVECPQFQEKGTNFTSYVLNVTSLRWLDETKVSRSLWWHFVVLFVPDNLEPRFANNAMIYITGNSNDDARPPSITDIGSWLPQLILVGYSREIVVTVFQIPNADILFYEEKPVPIPRGEDALIAWTWLHFMNDPSDPTWLARFPMVKGAIAAMNASTEFMAQLTAGPQTIENWVVAGASKRGWVTWMVGAFDPRVIAIAPLVFDELNFVPNIHHHYKSYGGWSFALKDYCALNLTGYFDDPTFTIMMSMIDPYNYFNNSLLADIPKLILSATGDEFLMNDNVRYFWDALPGEKHFHSFPNLEHSMGGNPFEVIADVLSFAVQVQLDIPRPVYSWSIDPVDGTITLVTETTGTQPTAQFWYADTISGNVRRDWRLADCPNGCPNPKKYSLQNVTWINDNSYLVVTSNATNTVYQAVMSPPATGWVGFLISLAWADGLGGSFTVSSAPSILPLEFPYPDCVGEGCIAGMV